MQPSTAPSLTVAIQTRKSGTCCPKVLRLWKPTSLTASTSTHTFLCTFLLPALQSGRSYLRIGLVSLCSQSCMITRLLISLDFMVALGIAETPRE